MLICVEAIGMFTTSTLHWYLGSWVLGYRHGKVFTYLMNIYH